MVSLAWDNTQSFSKRKIQNHQIWRQQQYLPYNCKYKAREPCCSMSPFHPSCFLSVSTLSPSNKGPKGFIALNLRTTGASVPTNKWLQPFDSGPVCQGPEIWDQANIPQRRASVTSSLLSGAYKSVIHPTVSFCLFPCSVPVAFFLPISHVLYLYTLVHSGH